MTLTTPLTVLDAARTILEQTGQPLHVRELTRRMLEQGLWTTTGKTPEASVYSKVWVSINNQGDASPFVQTAPATFALRPAAVPAPTPDLDDDAPAPHEPSEPPITRTFTNVAEAVLTAFGDGGPMHYREVTEIALREGLLTTAGKTPAATMSAQIYTANKRRQQRGEAPRFERLPGGFVRLLSSDPAQPSAAETQTRIVRTTLLARLRAMDPIHFELLVGRLLAKMGYVEVETTQPSHDGGVDVRAELTTGLIVPLRIAVQVKRHAANIRRPDVQKLRGSLHVHEVGLFVTTGGYSKGALLEARRPGASPISLVTGEGLVDLLVEHQVGVLEHSGGLEVMEDLLGDLPGA